MTEIRVFEYVIAQAHAEQPASLVRRPGGSEVFIDADLQKGWRPIHWWDISNHEVSTVKLRVIMQRESPGEEH